MTVKRQRWTDEEKKKAFNIFSNELEEKKLPSLAFCKEVIQENQVFKGRTPEMVKAFIYNTIKKS